MSDSPPLPEGVEAQLASLGRVDLLVGIPSYNNARTIGHVVRAAAAGLREHFPGAKALIVNADGGSTDGTPEVVANAERVDPADPATILVGNPAAPVAKIVTPYRGLPGKGSAFRTIFEVAARLEARACAVVDSDLRSIRPAWFQLLLGPILDRRVDYVAPLYWRHKFDGTITNGIVYPLTRALYGQRIRQPIGGDFGFSGSLARIYLSKPVWETDVARFGIDIWMTTTAVAEGFRTGQAFLGAKIHDAKDPGGDLTPMMTQVVGSCFALIGTYAEVWPKVRSSTPVPLFGEPQAARAEPILVNVERMRAIFTQGLKDLAEVWGRVLPDALLRGLREAAGGPAGAFRLADRLWAEVIYRFALAHHRGVLPRDHLLRSLIPLYLGRTASFVLEMWEAEAEAVEARIEALAETFEELKPLLEAEWAQPPP